jgi:PAS domain S-box-containing protein
MENMLLLQSDDYKEVFDNSIAAKLIIKADSPVYTVLDVNQAYLASTSAQRESIVGKPVFAVFPANPGDKESKNIETTIVSFEEAIRTKKPHIMSNYRYDIPIPGTDQFEERYWTSSNTPVLDENGGVKFLIHSPTDVTEMYKMEVREKTAVAAVKKQREQLFAIFMQAPVGIGILKGDKYVVDLINPPLCELYGKTREELIGKPIFDILTTAKGLGFEELLDNVQLTGVPYRGHAVPVPLNKNGKLETIYANFVYEPFHEADGKISGVIVIAIEVTREVEIRKKLEQSEANLKLAIESSNLGVWDLDIKANSMVRSQRHAEIMGNDFKLPWTPEQFREIVIDEDRPIAIKAIEEAYETGRLDLTVRILWPDKSIRWIHDTGMVIYDEMKQPIRMIGTTNDITPQKDSERLKDDFISIASHELKTPVTSLKASLQLLNRIKEDPAPAMLRRMIEQSNKSMEKISSLIEDLLHVSRMNEGQMHLNKTTFIMADVINDCCNHVREEGNYELIFQGDQHLQVFGDKHRIDQVVVNFVNNAVKYAPTSKEIYLTVEKQGNMARISVKDQGPGISADKLKHLFRRYYRADYSGNQYSGLGLGLYICSEIIKRHDGEIGAISELGRGSTFWFTLPLPPE